MNLYRCKKTTSNATGYPVDDGFVVCKGSIISEKVADSFEPASPSYYRLRNELIQNKTIVNRVFQQDYKFSSLSAAASVVVGWTISGVIAWVPQKTHKQSI